MYVVVLGHSTLTPGCFWAAQKAMKVPNRSKEGTLFLMELLDALEAVRIKYITV